MLSALRGGVRDSYPGVLEGCVGAAQKPVLGASPTLQASCPEQGRVR